MAHLSSRRDFESSAFVTKRRDDQPSDWPSRLARVALMAYLLPVIVLVLAIGGSYLLGRASVQLIGRFRRRARVLFRRARGRKGPKILVGIDHDSRREAQHYGRAHAAH